MSTSPRLKPLLCHVNLARGFRGGERQTELLVRGLAAHGIRQKLIVRTGAPLAQRLAGLPDLHLVEAGGPAGGLLATQRLLRGAALVHSHEGRGLHVCALHHRLHSVPYIATRRVLGRRIRGRWTRSVYYRAATVVAVSAAVEKILHGDVPAIKTQVLYDAISRLPCDAGRVRQLKQAWPEKLLIGNVAALDAKKGQIHLINVARRLQHSHPNLHFVLVGSGENEEYCRRQARGLNNLSMTGFVDNVGDYLAAFDVFVFPTYAEGLGSGLLDAMSFSLPLIASRVGGIPELVRHGDNGLLVGVTDETALRDAIVSLAGDPVGRAAMGAAGKRFADGFTVDRMVGQYLELYASVYPGFGKLEAQT
ncbi:MAG: glycosyltransferase family 4 protein [Gammaproteobacteria bacterium]|nr:glycosyltransferase family 4 protein [Gammaproteobacteria bacterium]